MGGGRYGLRRTRRGAWRLCSRCCDRRRGHLRDKILVITTWIRCPSALVLILHISTRHIPDQLTLSLATKASKFLHLKGPCIKVEQHNTNGPCPPTTSGMGSSQERAPVLGQAQGWGCSAGLQLLQALAPANSQQSI